MSCHYVLNQYVLCGYFPLLFFYFVCISLFTSPSLYLGFSRFTSSHSLFISIFFLLISFFVCFSSSSLNYSLFPFSFFLQCSYILIYYLQASHSFFFYLLSSSSHVTTSIITTTFVASFRCYGLRSCGNTTRAPTPARLPTPPPQPIIQPRSKLR